MIAILILLAVLAVGPLAIRYGADSRPHDARRAQRSNWS